MNPDIYVLIEHQRGQVANISYHMLAAARSLSADTGCSVIGVLLSEDCQALGADLAADRLLCVEDHLLAGYAPTAYRQILLELIRMDQPRLFLFGDTSLGAELAGSLSARLDCPLISSCLKFHSEAGKLIYTSQICGGKILVDGELPVPGALVTMVPGGYKAELGKTSQPPDMVYKEGFQLNPQPIRLKGYIEPDTSDIDISKEDILVSIGRGLQNADNLPMIQELADALGGVVCSSRPGVDSGWLPATRLVGKSGKRVKPKVYLALGISGAPEHAEAITESETIIAVNTDPQAPIFNLANYGATIDLFDLVPALTETILKAKQETVVK